MKAKTTITVESLMAVIEDKKPASLSQLAHLLGYQGSVSSTLTKKFRLLIPNIAELLAKDDHQVTSPKAPKTEKPVKTVKAKVANPSTKTAVTKPEAKPVGAKAGKHAHNEKSPFRSGSSYDKCFSILAAHPDGLPKEKLVQLLASETGKDAKHASYDAQVVLSAHGAAGENLNPFEGPRNRSARFGYWVDRKGDHVRLVLPDRSVATKGRS